jgi:hypothetical protein
MNAKIGLDLYRMNFSQSDQTMVVGVSAVNHGKGMVYALIASYSQSMSQCFQYLDRVQLPDEYLGSQKSKDE